MNFTLKTMILVRLNGTERQNEKRAEARLEDKAERARYASFNFYFIKGYGAAKREYKWIIRQKSLSGQWPSATQ